ncbi:MAG: flagellar hook-basal body complex protein [Candidatus Delongbacteria bacterium]|nr:flagellar hook-basal body complex protein [Candidatus Delongbacteria bacterium]
MMRSLTAGETGLRVHQTEMDVLSNNISNVNTIGFKSGRVTFQEIFTQTVKSATRPRGGVGGTNPIQVGLGLNVGSVDTDLTQGEMDSTGTVTDLAIEGDGYFILSNGASNFYSRAGAFEFDALGQIVAPTNGYILQGKMADSNGNIAVGTAVGNIKIPFGQKSPAKATSTVTFKGNLDASMDPAGTQLDTQRLYAVENWSDNSDTEGLYAKGNSDSAIQGLIANSSTVIVKDGTGNSQYFTYVASDTGVGFNDFHSLQDLVNEMNAKFDGSFSASWNEDGSISFTNTSTNTSNEISFTSSNANLQLALAAANGDLVQSARTTDQFSHIAKNTDLMSQLRDSTGDDMDLFSGDEITIQGLVGESTSYTNVGIPQPSHTGSFTIAETSTVADYINAIKDTFTIDQTSSLKNVELDSDGSIKVTGYGGTANKITYLNFFTDNNAAGNRQVFDDLFDATVGHWNTLQEAEDAQYSTTLTIYDSLGYARTLNMTFTKDTKNDKRWFWEISTPSTLESTGVVSDGGTISFNPDGSLASFEFERGNNYFEFYTETGAEPVKVAIDVGDIGDVTGISQFSSTSTVVADSQDGYSAGYLTSIGIDSDGFVTGVYTNGKSQTLAQLMLADFNNPAGLLKVGNNMYQETGNSGLPIVSAAGESIQGEIVPGALEQSNVDIAKELTEMIVAQRGFQANSRVITTADTLLGELVNLKR